MLLGKNLQILQVFVLDLLCGLDFNGDTGVAANRAQMIPMFTLTEYHFFTVAKGTA